MPLNADDDGNCGGSSLLLNSGSRLMSVNSMNLVMRGNDLNFLSCS
jgi:hypothetical protein